MERKTKYRILGILIVVCLIIVLLPLFFGEKNTETPDVAVIKTPPFPDQNMQVNNNTDGTSDVETIDLTKDESDRAISDPITQPSVGENNVEGSNQTPTLPNNVVENQVSGESKTPNTDVNTANEKTVSSNNVSTPATNDANDVADTKSNKDAANNATHSVLTKHEDSRSETTINSNDTISANIERSSVNSHHSKANQAATTDTNKVASHEPRLTQRSHINQKMINAPLNKNGLIDLEKPGWVIQIGSFKNKTNAIRLVNRLRAKGYPAFIQHVNNSAFGESIRVYVGPADKQKEASALLSQMEKDAHVAGIIISYKPLAL